MRQVWKLWILTLKQVRFQILIPARKIFAWE